VDREGRQLQDPPRRENRKRPLYEITLDPKQKRIDVFHHETPKGTWGGSLKGIYEIQGNTLKVCYDLKGRRYPKSFEAGRGSGQVVYTFQRVQGE